MRINDPTPEERVDVRSKEKYILQEVTEKMILVCPADIAVEVRPARAVSR